MSLEGHPLAKVVRRRHEYFGLFQTGFELVAGKDPPVYEGEESGGV